LIGLFAPFTIVFAFTSVTVAVYLLARRPRLGLALGFLVALGVYVYWTWDILAASVQAKLACADDRPQVFARRTGVSAVLLPSDVWNLDTHVLARYMAVYPVVVTNGHRESGTATQRWRRAPENERGLTNLAEGVTDIAEEGGTHLISARVGESDLPRYE